MSKSQISNYELNSRYTRSQYTTYKVVTSLNIATIEDAMIYRGAGGGGWGGIYTCMELTHPLPTLNTNESSKCYGSRIRTTTIQSPKKAVQQKF